MKLKSEENNWNEEEVSKRRRGRNCVTRNFIVGTAYYVSDGNVHKDAEMSMMVCALRKYDEKKPVGTQRNRCEDRHSYRMSLKKWDMRLRTSFADGVSKSVNNIRMFIQDHTQETFQKM